MTKPRLFSGMQPSADSLHIGNYVGALLGGCGQIARAGQTDLGALPALGDVGGYGRPVVLAHKACGEDVRVAAGLDRGRGELFPEPLAGAQRPRPEHWDREGVLRHGGVRRGRGW